MRDDYFSVLLQPKGQLYAEIDAGDIIEFYNCEFDEEESVYYFVDDVNPTVQFRIFELLKNSEFWSFELDLNLRRERLHYSKKTNVYEDPLTLLQDPSVHRRYWHDLVCNENLRRFFDGSIIAEGVSGDEESLKLFFFYQTSHGTINDYYVDDEHVLNAWDEDEDPDEEDTIPYIITRLPYVERKVSEDKDLRNMLGMKRTCDAVLKGVQRYLTYDLEVAV